MSALDIRVKCTRCRNTHMTSVRVDVKDEKHGWMNSVCPRCGCKEYYDQRPQVAWCWATGLVEVGDKLPELGAGGSGPITIATGPKSELELALAMHARRGFKHGVGSVLMVPGVPEASSQKAGADALSAWLRWCKSGGKRTSARWPGVVWCAEATPVAGSAS